MWAASDRRARLLASHPPTTSTPMKVRVIERLHRRARRFWWWAAPWRGWWCWWCWCPLALSGATDALLRLDADLSAPEAEHRPARPSPVYALFPPPERG